MNNKFFQILFVLFTMMSYAQEHQKNNFIEVVGTAEMLVEPDEVVFDIVLQTNDKNSLQDAEKKFFEILKKNNIKTDDVNFTSAGNNYWYYWWNNRNSFRKSFQIKLNPKTQVLSFLEDLNQKWVSAVSLSDKTHSKISEYRKEVKIKAMKAAKEKANYLLESIGNKAGKPIEIIEIEDKNSDEVMKYRNIVPQFANVVSEAGYSNGSVENIESIKLKYTIKAKFEIQ